MIGESAEVSRTVCHAPLAPTEMDGCEARRGWVLQFEMGLRIVISLRIRMYGVSVTCDLYSSVAPSRSLYRMQVHGELSASLAARYIPRYIR